MTPIAVLRWCVLHGGQKICPGRRYHLYLTADSVVREERDGETPLEIWALDDVVSVSFAPNPATAAAALALELERQ